MHGGARLHGMVLTKSMFAATEMVAVSGGEVAFEAMTGDQLKVELAERVARRVRPGPGLGPKFDIGPFDGRPEPRSKFDVLPPLLKREKHAIGKNRWF